MGSGMSIRFALGFVFAAAASAIVARGDEYIAGRGSAVVAQILAELAPGLKRDCGIEFRATSDSGSTDGIAACALGVTDVALSARMMTAQERAARPDKVFVETVIGQQALVVIVPDEIWRAGVKALTKDQLTAIYERDIKNWKDVGGPDREITFFNRESTRGVWDLYMMFLYGDVRKAPLSKAEVLNNPDETKTTVQFNSNSFSVLEFGAYKEGEGIHALGIKQPDGKVIEPTLANLASGRYEIARPLVVIAGKHPTGKLREFMEYMASDKGQAAVRKTWHVATADLEAEKKKVAPEK
jgi:phosphate transport system substrate-binding protein